MRYGRRHVLAVAGGLLLAGCTGGGLHGWRAARVAGCTGGGDEERDSDGDGDCEETSIVLSSVLQASPFGYDTVLVQPPGHMAVGIRGDPEMSGYRYEYEGASYLYVETTGEGWGIGEIPDVYRGERVRIFQV